MPHTTIFTTARAEQQKSDPAQIVYSSDLVRIATYRRHASCSDFEAPDRVVNGHLIVFPRTPVQINFDDGESVIANPNLVTMYNLHQGFHRKKISDRGDFCEWFAFAPEVLVDTIRRYDPQVEDRMDQPFTMHFGPSEPSCYLRQRLVVEHILQDEKPNKLFIEETAMSLLDDVIKTAYANVGAGESPVRDYTLRQHRDIAQAAQEILSTSFDQELTLNELASQLYVSPYLLCRIFRQQTGGTVHTYLNQLRLRTALEAVRESCGRLTDLALNLGYSSHSHFTQAFRNAFGITPTELQRIYDTQRSEKVNGLAVHGAMPYLSTPNHTLLVK